MEYTHACIKKTCGKQYKDTDPDPYYCESCQIENKRVAASISQRAPSPRMKSELELYEEAPKVRGFMRVSL